MKTTQKCAKALESTQLVLSTNVQGSCSTQKTISPGSYLSAPNLEEEERSGSGRCKIMTWELHGGVEKERRGTTTIHQQENVKFLF